MKGIASAWICFIVFVLSAFSQMGQLSPDKIQLTGGLAWLSFFGMFISLGFFIAENVKNVSKENGYGYRYRYRSSSYKYLPLP